MRRKETTDFSAIVPPVTLADAKLHARIRASQTKDDAYITEIIKAATLTIEGYTNKRYTARSFDLVYDSEEICPVLELETFNDDLTISAATLNLEDGTPQALVEGTDYAKAGNRIQFLDSFSNYAPRGLDALQISYSVALYTASPEIVEAIKEFVTHHYEHRIPVVLGKTIDLIPAKVLTLIQNDRIWNV